MVVITVPELAAEALGSFLADHMTRRFGSTDARLTEAIPSAARLALDCIGNSDALYHTVEHTMLVTLVCSRYSQGRWPRRLCDRRKGQQNQTSARRFGCGSYALPRGPLETFCDGSPRKQ